MPKFQSRSLSVLDRVLDFIGGTRSLSEFDLDGAVQPVFDLSRMAELGARQNAHGGYLSLGQTESHVGVGPLFTSSDLYALFDSVGTLNNFSSTGQRKDRLWLIDRFATISNEQNFESCFHGIEHNSPVKRVQILDSWQTAAVPLTNGGVFPLIYADGNFPPSAPNFSIPMYLEPGDLWTGGSVAKVGGVVDVRRHIILWAGPLGTTPPGMR